MSAVRCEEHGVSTEAFVCGHVLASLKDGQPRGFVYSSLDAVDEPSAYCSACDTMLQANGGEWTEALEERADIKLLCYGCFMKAARMNGVLS